MEDNIKIFEQPEFGKVRIIEENSQILFCGNDVAKALGYAKPRNAIATHCRAALKRGVVSQTINQYGTTTNQKVRMNFISEGDVYRLIVNSKLPSAQKFERWVFDEVLPNIRKQGYYILEQLQVETEKLSKVKKDLSKTKEIEQIYSTGTQLSRKQYIDNRSKRDKCRQIIDLLYQEIEDTIAKIETINSVEN